MTKDEYRKKPEPLSIPGYGMLWIHFVIRHSSFVIRILTELPSSSWGQLLFHLARLQRNVFRQAAFHGRFYLAFDERPGVLDKFFIRQEAILADPIARDKMF